ncbi:MAG: dTMP kinase [Candidatus Zixiibacteriota bacterium]|jgi:dTMP kinase
MPRGKLITFEGVEGAGKTTQLARAEDHLRTAGVEVVVAREPGGTAVGEQVRSVLLDPGNAGMAPRAELFLYLAARAQLVAEVVEPALEAGAVVLLDRYVHSTLAYQGYGLGVELGGGSAEENVRRLRDLCRMTVGPAWPDLVVLLDVDVEAGMRRIRPGGSAQNSLFDDRIEARDVAFHRRVREGFLALAREESGVVSVVDAAGSEDEVFAAVKPLLDGVL